MEMASHKRQNSTHHWARTEQLKRMRVCWAHGPENMCHCDGEGKATGLPPVYGLRKLLPHISADQEAEKQKCCCSVGFLLSLLCSLQGPSLKDAVVQVH